MARATSSVPLTHPGPSPLALAYITLTVSGSQCGKSQSSKARQSIVMLDLLAWGSVANEFFRVIHALPRLLLKHVEQHAGPGRRHVVRHRGQVSRFRLHGVASLLFRRVSDHASPRSPAMRRNSAAMYSRSASLKTRE